MASNSEKGTSKIQNGITSGVHQFMFMSNRLTICSIALQNLSKKKNLPYRPCEDCIAL